MSNAELYVTLVQGQAKRNLLTKVRTITNCELHRDAFNNTLVYVKTSCKGVAEQVQCIYTYYGVDPTITEEELIGMTEEDAIEYINNK